MSAIHSEIAKEVMSKPIIIYILLTILGAILSLTAIMIFMSNEDSRREQEKAQELQMKKEVDRKAFSAPLVPF